MRMVLAGLTLAAFASAHASTPILGDWLTQSGRVTIELCGDKVCGRIVDAHILKTNPDQRDVRNPDPTLRDRPILGLYVLSGFEGGPTAWSEGVAYNPETGESGDSSSLTLLDDGGLKVEGCVFLFCRSQVWRRP